MHDTLYVSQSFIELHNIGVEVKFLPFHNGTAEIWQYTHNATEKYDM